MSHRLEKLNKIFLREISEIVNREVEFEEDVLVTVTEVQAASDLSVAKVWVSVLPFEKSAAVMVKLMNERQNIQSILNQDIEIKRIPQLIFMLDESEEKASNTEKVINEVEK